MIDAEAQLHAHGYRSTPQRQLVFEAVRALPHATPEKVYQHVQLSSPGFTLSTVYRVLDVLEKAELITHAHIDSGPPCYHVAGTTPHIHFRCRDCAAVFSLPVAVAEPFVAAVRVQTGFEADMTHVGIQGLCIKCQKEDAHG